MDRIIKSGQVFSCTDKAVLSAIATFADNTKFNAYPSYEEIAFRASVSTSTAIRRVKFWKGTGLLHVTPGGGHATNHYWINGTLIKAIADRIQQLKIAARSSNDKNWRKSMLAPEVSRISKFINRETTLTGEESADDILVKLDILRQDFLTGRKISDVTLVAQPLNPNTVVTSSTVLPQRKQERSIEVQNKTSDVSECNGSSRKLCTTNKSVSNNKKITVSLKEQPQKFDRTRQARCFELAVALGMKVQDLYWSAKGIGNAYDLAKAFQDGSKTEAEVRAELTDEA